MGTSPDMFDRGMERWHQAQHEPWMRLRYIIAQHNLQRHIPNHSIRVLDIGGGNGLDSLALAEQGHSVTIVDHSAEMLADAKRRAAELNIEPRLKLVHAPLSQLGALFEQATFDLVLCHNVLQYVDDAATAIGVMGPLLSAPGLLSIILPNPSSEPLRVAFQQYDLPLAQSRIDASHIYTPLFEVDVRRYNVDEISNWLAEAGLQLSAHYGIRCICDYLADNERKYDPEFFEQLTKIEIAMSDTHPYYLIARFMHLLATKESSSQSSVASGQ